ncbi:T-complex protein 11-like protein 2 [Anopheles marshallii]|uniref:T-complex protein 11-like protein 2 n=1 Tax=Anopheles marshallii TaxID=1521116 RepID=UPI00237BD4C7|nr:T-complex protein 11-like protein 2 [Anopheles marshallii]
MPDNTGRDARMKKEELPTEQDNRKQIMDMLTKLMKATSLNDNNAQVIGFLMPATDNEPEKFVELSDLECSLEDMALVHEIAINDKFKLKPPQPNTLLSTVQTTMRDAYWNMLRAELTQSPPCYTMVIQLLLDIKEAFKALLTGNNDRALHAILNVLNEDNIRQLADEHGSALLKHNAEFIIKIMGMACCPARDAEVAALKRKTDPFTQLRGIMEVLDNMKLDMANFVLANTRAQFVRYSVEYERKKFGELQSICNNHFPDTMAWLKRNKPSKVDKPSVEGEEAAGGPSFRQEARTIQLNDVQMPDYYILAYQEYLQPDTTYPIPELLKLDHERMVQLKERALRICTCATVIQLTYTFFWKPVDFPKRQDLAAKLAIISMDYPAKTDLKDLLEHLWLQVRISIFNQWEKSQINAAMGALQLNILSINSTMPVYSIIWRKLMVYMKALIMNEKEENVAFPDPFLDYRSETVQIAGLFKRIVAHNFEVYGNFYQKSMQEC